MQISKLVALIVWTGIAESFNNSMELFCFVLFCLSQDPTP